MKRRGEKGEVTIYMHPAFSLFSIMMIMIIAITIAIVVMIVIMIMIIS